MQMLLLLYFGEEIRIMNARQKAKKYKALYESLWKQPVGVNKNIIGAKKDIVHYRAKTYMFKKDTERTNIENHQLLAELTDHFTEKFTDAIKENLVIQLEEPDPLYPGYEVYTGKISIVKGGVEL